MGGLFNSSWGDPADIIGAVLTAISLLFLWNRAVDKVEARLRDPDSRLEMAERIDGFSQGRLQWRLRLLRLNEWLDKVVFRGPWNGSNAFLRCYQIALIYPVALLLIAWVFFGEDNFGSTLRVFPPTDSALERTIRGLFTLLAIYLPIALYRNGFGNSPVLNVVSAVQEYVLPSRLFNDHSRKQFLANTINLIIFLLIIVLMSTISGDMSGISGQGAHFLVSFIFFATIFSDFFDEFEKK